MSKIILVTGASSGIGEAMADYLQGRGYLVYGTSRKITPEGKRFKTLPMDVGNSQSIGRAIESILAEQGRLDVVINNAGLGLAAVAEHVSLDQVEQVMDTNFLGVIRVCQAVLPVMRRQQSGLIINTSSIGSEIGLPYRGIYSASKAAVDRFTEALRTEVKPFGIQACSLQPGGVKTDISRNRLVSPLPTGSAYKESFTRTYQIINDSISAGLPAERFGPVVEKIIESKYVKRTYRTGKPTEKAVVWLKWLLPGVWFDTIIQRHYQV